MNTQEETNHTPKESKSIKKYKIITLSIIGVIFLLVIIFSAWLYTGNTSDAKKSFFKKLPLPVALVQYKTISSKDLYHRINLVEKLMERSQAPQENIEQLVLDQMINHKKLEVVARNSKISVSDQDIEQAFAGILIQSQALNSEAFETELKNTFGLELATFKNEVVKQTVLQDKLLIWFYGQESLNSQAYSTARDLLAQIDKGSSFEEVATKYTQDEASANFAGDNGFITYDNLLPEFQQAVAGMQMGDLKITASRFGIHIIKLNIIEDSLDQNNPNNKSYNLHQIFLKPADFQNWINGQTENIQSVKLL